MLRKIQKGVDRVLTIISSILLAVMFFVLVANVVLRLIPSIGGFSWYMEFSQYANVWAMMFGAAGIAIMGTNLRVEIIDSLLHKYPWGKKVTALIVDVSELVFYIIVTYSGYLLATKARQAVSTMPRFTMGQVYMIFPIAGALCIFSVVIHILVTVTGQAEEEEIDPNSYAAAEAKREEAKRKEAAK